MTPQMMPVSPIKTPWYARTWFTIVMLFVFAPIGCFLLWKFRTWNVIIKATVTVVSLFTFINVAMSKQPPASPVASTVIVNSVNPTPVTPAPTTLPKKTPVHSAQAKKHITSLKLPPIMVTALPGNRIQVSGTTQTSNNQTLLVTVEQKPSGFTGQSEAPVSNGTFQTEAFGPEGGLTPGMYTVETGYGETSKKSGFELRSNGSIVMTSSRYAASHAKPRKHGPYPMVNPDNYSASTAEHAMAAYLTAWKSHRWNKMADATQITWRSDQINPAQWLEDTYGSEDIVGVKITNANSVSASSTDVTYIVYVKDENDTIQERTTVGRVIREDGPMMPSPTGTWGVNPISTINNGP